MKTKFKQKFDELQNLEQNIELTKVKIIRAEKLISGLGGEKERWTQVSIHKLEKQFQNSYLFILTHCLH